jgi:FkbM family methyltransferase
MVEMSEAFFKLGDYTFQKGDIDLALYLGYTIDDLKVFEHFKDPDARPNPGFITDVMGIKTRVSSLWQEARHLDGQLMGYPVPGSFHAEAVEWIALLKSVLSASSSYTAMELGAGFGPWIVAGAVLARLRGLGEIHLCGVEGDLHHFQFMRQHLVDNGFDPAQHDLHQAAVGPENGEARWPTTEDSSGEAFWGFRPIPEQGGDYMGRSFEQTHHVKVTAINELVRSRPEWDMIHIDIQGGEYEVCRVGMADLWERAKRVIIGTHSRKIDGDLVELFMQHGWILEHEKPTKFTFRSNPPSLEAMTTVDGTQCWRNLRLLP